MPFWVKNSVSWSRSALLHIIFVCQERPILLAMPLTMPMGGNWMGQKRSAEGRGSPSCQLWRKPLRGGTLKLEDWWRSWELRWHATLGRRREKLSPICGAEWASCCSAAMLPFLGTGFQINLGPISMGFYNPTIHCFLAMINVWKTLKYTFTHIYCIFHWVDFENL